MRSQRESGQPGAVTVTRESEWWRGAALYQIYPRSFADSNGDGIGDLAGVTAHLDYVASLGVDGVWLSPFFTSPMRDFGYDVSDYRGVDPIFGTLADFDAMLERAHTLGLKVLIDQVWSHTALEHPWFMESRGSRDNEKADWYVWAEPKADGSPPNNWRGWMGGPAWSWEPRRRQYYLHNFLHEMPDLNFHCPAVQEAILNVARFWLDRGVDGFRLDVANFYFHSRGLEDNPPQKGDSPAQMQRNVHNVCQPENLAFLERVRAVLDGYRERTTMAEISSAESLERMVQYTRGSSRLHTAYSFLLLGERFDPPFIASLMRPWEDASSGGAQAWPTWAFSNHDTVRVASRWAGPRAEPQRCQQLIALLACLRGTIVLYQGEELGLSESEISFEQMQDPYGRSNWPLSKGRDGCRTPIPWRSQEHAGGFTSGTPWLPFDERHRRLAVNTQEAQMDSMLQFTRRVLTYRRERPELRRGTFELLVADETLLVFRRRFGTSVSIGAFNLGAADRAVEIETEPGLQTPAIVTGRAALAGGRLTLGAWAALVASEQFEAPPRSAA